MIKNQIEEFKINKCPQCNKKHNLKIDVYRDIIPVDINRVRVPVFNKINVPVICPVKKNKFNIDIMIQEDEFSRVIKLKRI
ncbi:MAG TPA: hypothetical protein PLE45_09610 [Spirochaetota bacterium]|nr:hypothetical protein [Spirochaetota bacterium]HOL56566.1 hypothetical protein [Spirochaetota bacterium]HPP04901.1 hypothetical protein [Spirochaetota bacterium]